MAPHFGTVDFQKNCEEHRGFFLPPSGILVPYYRCGVCGFLFTRFFDHWTGDEFQAHIYNEAYAEVDPEYAATRPEGWASTLVEVFGEHLPRISALDYGGGSGRLAEKLRETAIQRAETWDPFNPVHMAPPTGEFNFISCIEVLEHLPDPKAGMKSLVSHLPGDGAILISTVIQPLDIGKVGMDWWYLAPRNGHISLHTGKSMELLLGNLGFQYRSTKFPHIHWAWRSQPFFVPGA
jgi:2-polyprenyl-6-hydroxyphenyl methylase/3-demethylubiquinone-9 3-methyltransferase